MNKKRIIAFIDGYNLYHAIDQLNQDCLKWLDLRELIKQYVRNTTEEIADIYYFTALAKWKNKSGATGTSPVERHKDYILALKSCGVTTVYGKFKKKQKYCHHCKTPHNSHEEKETDVNIAMYLTNLAHKNQFDKAIIVSADSDLIPPIKLIQSEFPEKEVHVLIPPNYYNITREIRDFCNASKIKQKTLKKCLLKGKIQYQTKIIIRDEKYKP